MQSLELVPPVLERYRPEAQVSQLVREEVSYCPAPHRVQSLELVPPVLERYRPEEHDRQVLPDRYLPAAQSATQLPPLTLKPVRQ